MTPALTKSGGFATTLKWEPLSMKFSALPLLAALLITNTPLQAQTMEDNFQIVVERYREFELRSPLLDEEKLKGYIATLGADGRWPDIDYSDVQPGGWKTAEHLTRIRALSQALVNPQSPLHDDAKAEDAVFRALGHWIEKRYHNPNWWHNDIGVPQMMRDIVVLLGPRLQGARRDGALQVYHQYGKARPGDGANTMWMAELALLYGAIMRDADLVARNSKLIGDEIKITRGDGIQSDASYHQHSARLQQFHYGGTFLNNAARLGWQLSGTPWAIPKEKLQIVADCILQGSQWMARGIYTVPGTLDRSVSRPNAMQGADLRSAARFLREALPQSATELDALIARQDGNGTPLNGFRNYPRSDFAAYQRPNFSFFLKTISDRTLTTEAINNENLKGHLLNSGDYYLLRDGQEYLQLPPVWNWDLLPGVTYAKGAGEIQRQPLAGAVTDGLSGATAMDYRFGNKTETLLSARKFWACHGDTVVCLIGDLQTKGVAEAARTALDQSLLRGAVTIGDAQSALKTLPVGNYPAQSLRWIHHAGFAFVPLANANISLQLGPATGPWSQINKSASAAPVTLPVFLPVLEHDNQQGQSYGFVIASAPTAQDAAKIAAQPSWQVLRNDAHGQAVRFADGTLMAAFYVPGALEENGRKLLEAGAACLVLKNKTGLWLCDPTQKGGRIILTSQGKTIEANLPSGGLTVKVGL
jgi:chondroitin AC lyase